MSFFIYGDNARPMLIICLSFAKLLTFSSLVLNVTGFNLSCLSNPHKIFPSKVMSG